MSFFETTTVLYTFLIHIVFCLGFIPGALASDSDDIQLSASPDSSQPTTTYTFKRDISWTNKDFDVKELSSSTNNAIKVRFSLGSEIRGTFKFSMETPEGNLEVKVNKYRVWCGFSQTYKISNGVQFSIDPRGGLADRWYIKKSGNIKQKYTYERAYTSNKGYIISEDHRKVAYFGVKVYDSEELSNVYRTKMPGTTLHRIVTNSEIPIEDLVALSISTVLRYDKCNQ